MTAVDALSLFLDAIDATGGVIKYSTGAHAPEGDPDWTDLGAAYVAGCNERNRVPIIRTLECPEDEG